MNSSRTRQKALAVISVLLVLLGILGLFRRTRDSVGVDFLHYSAVSRVKREVNLDSVYNIHDRILMGQVLARRVVEGKAGPRERLAIESTLRLDDGKVETLATPFLFSLFSLISTDSYEFDYQVWRLLSIVCFALSVFLLLRTLGLPGGAVALVLALLMTWFEPLDSDIRVGNVNCLQLLVLVSAVLTLLRGRRATAWVAGFLLAAIVMFKPNVWLMAGLPFVFCLIHRKAFAFGSLVFGGISGILLSVVAGLMYANNHTCWLYWYSVMSEVFKSKRVLLDGNVGLVQTVNHVTGLETSMFFAVIMLLVIGIWIRIETRADSTNVKSGILSAVSLGGGLMVLTSRLVWPHYYVLIVPMLALLVREVLQFRDRKIRAGLAALSILLLTLAASACPGQTALMHAGFLNTGTGIGVVLCLMERGRRRAAAISDDHDIAD